MEKKALIKLFEDLFEGSPWIDVNIMDTLEKISPATASAKIYKFENTIWQIVQHVTSWRLTVLQRVQGKQIASPADNYFRAVADQSPAAWKAALENLRDSQAQWLAFLETMEIDTLSNVHPQNTMTNYEHIHGILQHDAYHLGQITLMAKYG